MNPVVAAAIVVAVFIVVVVVFDFEEVGDLSGLGSVNEKTRTI